MGMNACILIVDDEITIRHYIRHVLSGEKDISNEILEAEDGNKALDILRERRVDLVLCDVSMEGMDGITFLVMMKARKELLDIPVIMLTAEESVEMKVKGFEAGASDYLIKPFDENELIARVRVQLKVKHLQDELKRAKDRYHELSITDYLTGIYNRRYFIGTLVKEFEKARRYHLPLSLVIIDIDHFKQINDTYGHLRGDSVIVEVSQILKSNLRSHDVLARYGGEEFVLLLPMTGKDEAGKTADKLLGLIKEHEFSGLKDSSVTVSIGVCSYPGDGIDNIDKLIARSDDSLYLAKKKGRDRVVVHQ